MLGLQQQQLYILQEQSTKLKGEYMAAQNNHDGIKETGQPSLMITSFSEN